MSAQSNAHLVPLSGASDEREFGKPHPKTAPNLRVSERLSYRFHGSTASRWTAFGRADIT